MSLTELWQIGIGTAGTGGGLYAIVRAFIALKPYLNGRNGNKATLEHLEKQYDALRSIAADVHTSTERLGEFVRESREYQTQGRLAMQRVADLWERQP